MIEIKYLSKSHFLDVSHSCENLSSWNINAYSQVNLHWLIPLYCIGEILTRNKCLAISPVIQDVEYSTGEKFPVGFLILYGTNVNKVATVVKVSNEVIVQVVALLCYIMALPQENFLILLSHFHHFAIIGDWTSNGGHYKCLRQQLQREGPVSSLVAIP